MVSYPVTSKVVEYREKNLRQFLFTESLQIIQSPRSSRVHSLLQLSPHVFKSGYWDGHGRSLILCSVNHFSVDLDVCFGWLSFWKIQLRPRFSFLARAAGFRFKISWYFMEFMMPCTLTRFPGPWGHNWLRSESRGSHQKCDKIFLPSLKYCQVSIVSLLGWCGKMSAWIYYQ